VKNHRRTPGSVTGTRVFSNKHLPFPANDAGLKDKAIAVAAYLKGRERTSNVKAIANRFIVRLVTIKWHARNIYSKLPDLVI
jgi:hypothetical protein